MSVEVVTFGCRLNAYESEVIRDARRAAGRRRRRRRQHLRGDRRGGAAGAPDDPPARRERPDARIVVTGCAAQTEPQTFAAMPEVALVLGNDEKISAEFWAEQRDARHRSGSATTKRSASTTSWRCARPPLHLVDGIEGRARAFVQVQNGCDHRCTFCIIPYRPRQLALGADGRGGRRRCAGSSSNGYREVVLTGVDITSYGADLPGAPRLGELVRQILKHVPELARLRLSSIDSVEVDARPARRHRGRAAADAASASLAAGGDDLILKRMKRRHLRADAIAFCRPGARACAPTSCSAPTSSRASRPRPRRCSRARCDLVDECGLTHLHVFPVLARAPARRPRACRRCRVQLRKERARALRAGRRGGAAPPSRRARSARAAAC